MAQKMKGNEYVVMYDPFNEPSPAAGSLGGWLITNTVPGHFDRTVLEPMYTRIFKEYHSIDPSLIMGFEPTALPPDVVFPVGFYHPPGEVNSTHHVINEHTYCCGPFSKICIEEVTTPQGEAEVFFFKHFCNYFQEFKFYLMKKDIANM